MTDKHLLFYSSERCEYSNLFIKKLKSENLLNEFKLIDVLELYRNGKKIPPEITNIPTIIIKNMAKPLTGEDAFNWIETNRYFYQKTNNVNNPVKIAALKIDEFKDGADLKIDEFANIKDTDDDIATKKKYNGASQNTLIIGDQIKQQITEQKMSSDVQNKKLQELLQMRKNQLSKYTK